MYIGRTRNRAEARFSCEGIRSLSDSIFVYRPEVERQIQDMLQQGIIKQSTSRMASPLVMVKKKDGSLPLACDYRYINSFTIECQYPMPIVKDVLNKVGQSNVISIFDCRSAYWICPVT